MVKEKKFYKSFFALMIPMALQSIVNFGGGLADNMMIGGYSEAALSAVALVNQLQFFLTMMIGGLSEGIVVMGSQYWGEKNTDKIKQVMGIGFRVSIIVSVAISLITFIFPAQYMEIFQRTREATGALSAQITAEGIVYMRIMSFTWLFLAPVEVILSTLRSVESVKIGFTISSMILFVDIIFNYILIYGKLGFPEMGVAGAAISTSIGKALEFFILLWYLLKKDDRLFVKIKDFTFFDMNMFKNFMKISTPVILSGSSWGIAMWIQTYLLSSMGDSAVSANSIATTVAQVMMVFVYGGAKASNVLIGKTIGENKIEKIKPYSNTLQIIYLILGFSTGVIIYFSRDFFLGFYGGITPESKMLARDFLAVLSVTGIGTAYQMSCLTGIIRGGGDTKFVFYNDLIFMWGIVLPTSIIAAKVLNLSPVIVFMCLKSDQILKCLVAVVKVNRYKWIKKIA